MDDLERLKRAVREGEVAACVPLADALSDTGHPHAEELGQLAVMIGYETDAAVVAMAVENFTLLMEMDS